MEFLINIKIGFVLFVDIKNLFQKIPKDIFTLVTPTAKEVGVGHILQDIS